MALYMEDLDTAVRNGCETPGCTHKHGTSLFLHARCHMRAGTEVEYNSEAGMITVRCVKCKKMVAEIMVAAKVIM